MPSLFGVQSMHSSSVEKKVHDALATLESVKQEILRQRFGMHGSHPLSHEELAEHLTAHLAPELKLELATRASANGDEAILTKEDVVALEAEALRELTRPKRSARYFS